MQSLLKRTLRTLYNWDAIKIGNWVNFFPVSEILGKLEALDDNAFSGAEGNRNNLGPKLLSTACVKPV